MNYPLISEYIESIKCAEDNFATLTNFRPVLDESGNPIMSSGNFAVVFKMKDVNTGKFFGLKCFTREQIGRDEAYELISEELLKINSINTSNRRNYLIDIKYYKKELFVDSKNSIDNEFPVLIMDWVEGVTLDKYIKNIIFDENFDKYSVNDLKQITLDFLDFAYWLINQDIAHGDIKPDNIIITRNNKIVIVDYDGMYVPKMHGQLSREYGSPHYRHPNRDKDYFNASIDDFSLSVIAFSLAAIAINRKVYNNDIEDALVLSENNFRNIFNPELSSRLNLVLHDKLCSSLYSSILMQLSNIKLKIDLSKIFNLKTYIDARPPQYIPFKLGENSFQIYDTSNGTCVSNHIFSDVLIVNDAPNNTLLILSYGGEIDYTSLNDFSDSYMRVTDFILLEERLKRPKANLFALLSNKTNINNLKWYKLIKPIPKRLFLVKNNENKMGVISECNVILPCEYESIEAITQNVFLYLICKTSNKDNCIFLFTEDHGLERAVDGFFNDKCWHYKDGASAPGNLIIFYDEIWKGYDMERAQTITLPSNLKRIKSYSEQILCVETWKSEKGLRLFNADTASFLNDDFYLTVGFYKDELRPFKNGQTVCETRLHKNIIVFKDGSSFVIPFEEYRLNLGKNCNYIYYNHVVIEGASRSGRGYDIEFTIYNYKNKELYSFIYNWSSYGMREISIIDDAYIKISSHNMKYNMTTLLETLDLKGNPIEKKQEKDEIKSVDKINEPNLFEENMIFRHYICSNFVNEKYIHNVAEYERDYAVECVIKSGYVLVRGITNVDPEFGVSYDVIGYADLNRCYWKY